MTKRYLYGEAGVTEYWIVDPSGVIERRTGPALSVVETISDRLESDMLPGFYINLSELF